MVRLFENGSPHPEDTIDPVRDWNIVEMELIFRDRSHRGATLENTRQKTSAAEECEKELLERCQACLLEERPLREMFLSAEELRVLSGFSFVTLKPELLVANVDETQTDDALPSFAALKELAGEKGIQLIKIYGRMEMELAELSREEQTEFMDELGLVEPGRNRLVSGAYSLLGLISFFTTGKDEVKAWTLLKGKTAVDAAGAIHSDLARGFIRARLSLRRLHGQRPVSAQVPGEGRAETRGKDYIVADGDMIEIRFNV